eukprot:jgi/Picsp_1/6288/NSC_03638-R1_fad-dependent oxidoreductase
MNNNAYCYSGSSKTRRGNNPLVTLEQGRVVQRRCQRSGRNANIHQGKSLIYYQGARCLETDVCIVGSGVIGLSCAHRLLERGHTCTIVDAHVPCSGATGAGQGYIWMAHRDPLSRGAWKMAEMSKAMWERQMASRSGSSFGEACEWNRNGSLLISTTSEESESLLRRVQLLQDAGIEDAVYLDHRQVTEREACLCGSKSIQGGVLTPSDGQINGRKTAEALLSSCRSFGGKFEAIFHDGCSSALVDDQTDRPRIYGVELESGQLIQATKGVVIACGAWTGSLLDTMLGELTLGRTRTPWKEAILPSRGHLLVVRPDTKSPKLGHGIMESTYTKHYDRNTDAPSQEIDITFTATRNFVDGTVLLGSSREVGQPLAQRRAGGEGIQRDNKPDHGIVRRILDRAYEFVPSIFGDNTVPDIADGIIGQQGRHSARVGLRPFAFGHPLVGPIPEAAGLYIAAGHEGSGLTLGPITAEIMLHHISNTNDIDLEDILSYLSISA